MSMIYVEESVILRLFDLHEHFLLHNDIFKLLKIANWPNSRSLGNCDLDWWEYNLVVNK